MRCARRLDGARSAASGGEFGARSFGSCYDMSATVPPATQRWTLFYSPIASHPVTPLSARGGLAFPKKKTANRAKVDYFLSGHYPCLRCSQKSIITLPA